MFYIFMVKTGHGFAAKPRPSLAITSQRREGARGGLDVTHAPELMRDWGAVTATTGMTLAALQMIPSGKLT